MPQLTVTGLNPSLPLRVLQGIAQVKVNTNGHFRISGLAPGRYDLAATGPNGVRYFPVDLRQALTQVSLKGGGRAGPPTAILPLPDMPLQTTRRAAKLGGWTVLPDVALEDPAKVTFLPVSGTLEGATTPAQVILENYPALPHVLDIASAGPTGRFALSAPGPGRYMLTASREGAGAVRMLIQVAAGGITGLSLPASTGSAVSFIDATRPKLTLRIQGPDGQPLVTAMMRIGIRVVSAGTVRQLSRLISTDDTGAIDLQWPYRADIAAGSSVTIEVHAIQAGSAEIHVVGWPTAPVTLHLTPGATLTGSVLDAQNQPLVGVAVILYRMIPGPGGTMQMDPGSRAKARTNRNGVFTAPGLLEGTYDVRATIPGKGVFSKTVVAQGATGHLTLSDADHPVPSLIPAAALK